MFASKLCRNSNSVKGEIFRLIRTNNIYQNYIVPSSETTNDEGRIKLLLERFKTATLIVDRRDAMDNLRVLASANQKLVANLTFSDLMSTLKVERDEDLIQLTVETLVELVTIQEDNGNLIEKGGESVPLDSKEASNQNAELLLKVYSIRVEVEFKI